MYFEIYGYDSNFDFGGSHVRPLLCTVKANSIEQVEKYAMTLEGFYDLPCRKGYIKKITVIDLTEDMK